MFILSVNLQFVQHLESLLAFFLVIAQIYFPTSVVTQAMLLQIVQFLETTSAFVEVAREHCVILEVRSCVSCEKRTERKPFIAMLADEFALLMAVDRLLVTFQMIDVLE